MKKRKAFIQTVCIVLVVLMILSVSVMVIVPALGATKSELQSEIASLKSERSDIEARIEELEAQIEDLDYQRASTLEKKAILDEKNQLAQEELAVIEEQIAIIETYMANRQADLENARTQEAEQEEAWLSRLRAMEENSGSTGYLQVIFAASDFSDLLTRIDMVNEIAEYDEALWTAYTEARENVEVLEAEAEEMFALNEANKAELETKKAQLEADIEAACQMIADLEATLEGYNQLRDEEEAAMEAVREQIAEKEADLAAIIAAEEEEARRQAQAATGNVSGGSVNVSGGSGSLLWPSYTSLVTSYYGDRLHPVYGTWRFHSGIDIGAAGGTAIWASADGVVTVSGYDSGYGNYVSISHDNGYSTLYAHMSSRAVSAGQRVSQGQVIGYVGTTGTSTGYHIHYEVRSGGSLINPLSVSFIYA